MKIGETVKRLRNQLGLLQSELAELSYLTQATISRLEAGKHEELSGGALKRIASVLEVNVDYLLGNTTQMSLDKITVPPYEIKKLVEWYQKLAPEFRKEVLEFVIYAQKPFAQYLIEGLARPPKRRKNKRKQKP